MATEEESMEEDATRREKLEWRCPEIEGNEGQNWKLGLNNLFVEEEEKREERRWQKKAVV